MVTDVILPVNRSRLETTLFDTFWKPPVIVLANAAPGRVGIAGTGRGPLVVLAGCTVGWAGCEAGLVHGW